MYVLVAILTTASSITAAYLDEVLLADTRILSKRMNAFLSNNQNRARIGRCKLWRVVLERLILALADQQLVAGFAILTTGWIVYHAEIDGAHFTLVVYLSYLSSNSHLAAIITLREYIRAHPALAILRIVLIVAFAIVLLMSIGISQTFLPIYSSQLNVMSKTAVWMTSEPVAKTFSVLPVLWTFWTGIWQIVPDARAQFTARVTSTCWPPISLVGCKICRPLRFARHWLSPKTKDKLRDYARATAYYIFFLSPGTVFVLQIALAALSLAMVLLQKFSPGNDGGCSLNSPDENKMGYGQILACLMLALPIIAAIEAYKGELHLRRMPPDLD